MDELLYVSAAALARAIRAKDVSSAEVVEAHLRRIDEVNPQLNAVVYPMADAARQEALEADAALARGEIRGPLHGVPMTIKGAWDTAGAVSTGGTLGRANFVATEDATAVARLRAAGAIPLGMTNLPDLSLAWESDNLVYGRTNNPYDLSRTPGGSGGGGAAIIAASGSPFEIGGDMGGSIRVPCHFCGLAGLKPTLGRIPLTGYFPGPFGIATRLACPGPMARWVEDLALTLPILAGPDWRDATAIPMPLGDSYAVNLKTLRVAFFTDNGIVSPTPETGPVVRAAAQALREAGAAVEEIRPPVVDQALDIFIGLLSGDAGEGVRSLLQMAHSTRAHPLIEQLLDLMRARAMSTAKYAELLVKLDIYRSEMLAFLEKRDAILCPVAATPAIPHGTCFQDEVYPHFSYAVAHNLTGWPAATVRGSTSPEGLPIGVQIVAGPAREDVALAVAAHLETALRGFHPPPLFAQEKAQSPEAR